MKSGDGDPKGRTVRSLCISRLDTEPRYRHRRKLPTCRDPHAASPEWPHGQLGSYPANGGARYQLGPDMPNPRSGAVPCRRQRATLVLPMSGDGLPPRPRRHERAICSRWSDHFSTRAVATDRLSSFWAMSRYRAANWANCSRIWRSAVVWAIQ